MEFRLTLFLSVICNEAAYYLWETVGDCIKIVAASRRVIPSSQVSFVALLRRVITYFGCFFLFFYYAMDNQHLFIEHYCFIPPKYIIPLNEFNLFHFHLFRTCTTVSWTFRIFYEKVIFFN